MLQICQFQTTNVQGCLVRFALAVLPHGRTGRSWIFFLPFIHFQQLTISILLLLTISICVPYIQLTRPVITAFPLFLFQPLITYFYLDHFIPITTVYPLASLAILQIAYLYYSCSLLVTRLFQPFLYHFQLFQPGHLAVYPIAISSVIQLVAICFNCLEFTFLFANCYNFSISLLLARQFQSFIPYFQLSVSTVYIFKLFQLFICSLFQPFLHQANFRQL